jgi:threonine synthase
MTPAAFLKCIIPACGATRDLTATDFSCPKCGNLLDVGYDWDRLPVPRSLPDLEGTWGRRRDPLTRSGVWRFYSLLPFAPPEAVLTVGEGQTLLRAFHGPAGACWLQHEGFNPSGSFKDNGMTAALTHARLVGATRAACASTGNTSASLALYGAATRTLRAVVFIGSGKVSAGKLAQALDHGALTLQIAGDFDDAMRQVQDVSRDLGLYLVNSVNPVRLEGQKTIMYRVLEALEWDPPDWVVVPGGNLGNVSSFGKAFEELTTLGLIARRPRLAVINAAGAETFFQLYERGGLRWNGGSFDRAAVDRYYAELDGSGRRASTIASAIEINRPVNLPKALRALEWCRGVVRSVSDQEILDAKAEVAAGGFGCEPASAASVAGWKRLRAEGVIGRDERVVCVLTGHALKDPDVTSAYHGPGTTAFTERLARRGVATARHANPPVALANDLEAIIRAIESDASRG